VLNFFMVKLFHLGMQILVLEFFASHRKKTFCDFSEFFFLIKCLGKRL
jgi:hypothetical protein